MALSNTPVNQKGGFGRLFFSSDRVFWTSGVIALACAWLIPNHYPPWRSFYNEGAAIIGLACFALASRRSPAVSLPLTVWLSWGMASVPLLQWLVGRIEYGSDALLCIFYISAWAAAMAVGAVTARSGSLMLALSIATLCSSVVSSLIAILQVFDLARGGIWLVETSDSGQPVANLGHWNLLATLLALGLVSLLYLFESGRLGSRASIGLATLLVVGLGITRSRTALSYGPIVLMAVWLAGRRGIKLRTTVIAVIVAICVQWSVHALIDPVRAAMHYDVSQLLTTRGTLETPRWRMWWLLLNSMSAAPWSGYGWLQVGAAELAQVNHYPPIDELWLQAHNVLLELVIWNGWPLGLALDALLVYWLVSRWRFAASRDAIISMVAISILFTHSLLEFPYQYAYFLIPLGFWIGTVEGPGSSRRLSPKFNAVPALVAAGAAVAIAWDYPKVEEDFRTVRFQNMKIGATSLAATVEAPILSSLTAFLTFARTEPHAGMSADELASFAACAKRYPYAPSLSRWARALALNGRAEEAHDRFISIRQMFGSPTYRKLRQELLAGRSSGPEYEVLRTFREELPDD